MKAMHWTIAAAALAFGQPTPALAATTDPEVIIYRFPGVSDDGNVANTGVATVFHCTNFSGVAETLRLVTRFSTGNLASNVSTSIVHLATRTLATHNTVAYDEDVLLVTGLVAQGTTAIAATSINSICTAETISASTAVPTGVARRGIRFNPVPGSQE